MFRLCDRITFCIRLSTDLFSSNSTDHAPSTLIIMLNCFTSYPGYCCLISSHLSGPYCFFSRSVIHPVHFNHRDLLSLFVYYSRINSVCSHLRILCIDRYIPESFSFFILVQGLRLDWREPWWYLGYQTLQNLQSCICVSLGTLFALKYCSLTTCGGLFLGTSRTFCITHPDRC